MSMIKNSVRLLCAIGAFGVGLRRTHGLHIYSLVSVTSCPRAICRDLSRSLYSVPSAIVVMVKRENA